MDEIIKKKEKKQEMQELKDVLSVVSTEIPSLIKNIFKSIYNAESASEYGKAIGQLYKELKENGLPEDMISKIVLEYSNSLNLIGDAVKQGTNQKKKLDKDSNKVNNA